MDGHSERHHKSDLLAELASICKKENVTVPTKSVIDKYHALGKCVSYGRYLAAFGGKENLEDRFREHLGLPERPAELSLFA